MEESAAERTSTSAIRISSDDGRFAGLHKLANNASGQSLDSSIASEPRASAVAADPTMADAKIIVGESSSQQEQQKRRLSNTRIEGMDQLEKPVMDDGSSNFNSSDYANMTDAEIQMREEELSFYSANDNEHGDDNIWGLMSGVGGNIYEWCVLVSLSL